MVCFFDGGAGGKVAFFSGGIVNFFLRHLADPKWSRCIAAPSRMTLMHLRVGDANAFALNVFVRIYN